MLQDTRYLETARSWTNEEAREALRSSLAEQACALHAEITDLVHQGRVGKYELCARLARMRDEALWKHLGGYTSFADYAVKVGAAESKTAAKDMAGLARQLRPLPHLHAVFKAGKADWTKVKEAAPAALARPEDDARWAEEVQISSVNEVRAKAQVALGKTPTRSVTLLLPRDVHALWEHARRVTGERTGVVLTQGEFVELLLDAATRAGLTDGRLVSPPATGRAQEAGEGEVDGEGSAGPTRIPPPTAVLHAFVCRCCEAVEVEGPDGPVTLAPERAAVLTEDTWVQDPEGNLTRAIPERVRRLVYARDRGRCRMPGCGALGAIHVHHVGEGGWKKTGHEADGLLLLCALCHRRHHHGWFSIHGGHAAGFRFLDPDGNELLGPMASPWWPTPPSISARPAPREAERMAEATPTHSDDVLQDVRAALRSMQFKAEEAKALLAHVLPRVPADATASQIVVAVLQAKR